MDEALASVRKTAEEAGTAVQANVLRPVPQRACGNPEHIHHLITVLAAALREIAKAKTLDLRASFDAQQAGSLELALQWDVTTMTGIDALRHRIVSITDASARARAVWADESELALASAWQLARAMDGRPCVETTEHGKLRVRVTLPLRDAAILDVSSTQPVRVEAKPAPARASSGASKGHAVKSRD
jgi:hypothetical protein